MHSFKDLVRVLLLLSALGGCNPAQVQELSNLDARAHTYPNQVQLRVEGAKTTIFEGIVLKPSPRDIYTAMGGSHPCTGTNNGANPNPGPTVTTVLDQASAQKSLFTFDGPYYPANEDYIITKISDDIATNTKAWGFLLNSQIPITSGCQTETKKDDFVVWAYNLFNKNYYLALSGPSQGVKNKPITFKVIDRKSGKPVSGATVSAYTPGNGTLVSGGPSGVTGAKGTTKITVTKKGTYHFKANEPNSIRSNAIKVVVAAS